MRVDTIQMDMVLYDARECVLFPCIVDSCSVEHGISTQTFHGMSTPEWTPIERVMLVFKGRTQKDLGSLVEVLKYYTTSLDPKLLDAQLINKNNTDKSMLFGHCYVMSYVVEVDIFDINTYTITVVLRILPAC